jgi:hypothetical protein
MVRPTMLAMEITNVCQPISHVLIKVKVKEKEPGETSRDSFKIIQR